MSPAILTVISIIAQILSGLIPQLKLSGLTASILKLVDEIVTQLPTLWAALSSGGSTTLEVTAALLAIQAVAKEAAADTNLDPVTLAWVQTLDTAAQKALAADTAAQANVDPSTLTDIEPL
ncbi:MAG TPA: hypothetical protein VK604_01375 [Bryobacteraceae bacterium]|nr:hypothetical protein [Bryobacteraceae bacterium]